MTNLTMTQHYDDFDEDFNTRFPLPFLEGFGVRTVMHDAVHKAATHRKIVAIIGGKGLGKTERLKHAREWFEERERLRHSANNGYAPQRMLIRKSSRNDSYLDTLIALSLELDARTSIKDRGRRKAPSQLLEQITILAREKRVAVLGLDEGEVLRKETIDAYRDVVAHAGDAAKAPGGGIGLVIAGSPACETLLQGQEEFGHRITELVRIPGVTIAEAVDVMHAWLPQARGLEGDDAEALRNIVREHVCHDRSTNMRRLEGIVKEYARRLQLAKRLVKAKGWCDVPIDRKLLRAVADAFADEQDQGRPRGPNV
jgi:hypothetical protein